MKKTRLSLGYLGSYLTLIGLGLLVAPDETLKLLQSNADYGNVFPRVAGMLMSGLGLAVFGIIRARAGALSHDALHPYVLSRWHRRLLLDDHGPAVCGLDRDRRDRIGFDGKLLRTRSKEFELMSVDPSAPAKIEKSGGKANAPSG